MLEQPLNNKTFIQCGLFYFCELGLKKSSRYLHILLLLYITIYYIYITTSFLLHRSEENFIRLFVISFLQFEKLMETGSLYLGHLHSSFLNFLFWTIRTSPVTICLSVNDDVVQLPGKLFILSKMFLERNVFINSLWLNILDRIALVNVCTVEICSILLTFVSKFFFTFLPFIILLIFYHAHAFVYKV